MLTRHNTQATIRYTHIQQHKKGARIWLQGPALHHAGFPVGTAIRVAYLATCIQVTAQADGGRKISRHRQGPVMDITNQKVAALAGPLGKVRVAIETRCITIRLHPWIVLARQREERLGAVWTMGTLFAGAGISSAALRAGLAEAGVPAETRWLVDRESRYPDLAARLHPEAHMIAADLEEVEADLLFPVDLLHVTLPCTRFSVAARNRQKGAPEAEPDATSVWGFLRLLEHINPTFLVFENVVAARKSAGYCLIRAALRRMGYCLHAAILDRYQAGSLESRRWWLVAVSAGLGQPEMHAIPPYPAYHATLADALEDVPIDGAHPYLTEKAKRDGRAFQRLLVTGSATHLGTIGRGYHKRRSCEPMLTDGDQERLLTPLEHARVKGIPDGLAETLLAGVCPSVAHRVLGQSVLWGQAYSG
ncbi:MAG: DNA cytosine methyltransferase [Acidobacteriota bacterium]|nr:DNA cytosine methyltransferase [Acidobacteriota bacterium]